MNKNSFNQLVRLFVRVITIGERGIALDRLELRVDSGPTAGGRSVCGELGREAPAGFKHVRAHDLRHTYGRRSDWWVLTGSNRRPSPCKGGPAGSYES